MSQEFIQSSDELLVRQYLATSKTLALVRACREETTSNQWLEMQARGYQIIPVNPKAAGGEDFGREGMRV